MKFVADLHLHSKYSRAVSPQMTLENIERWARYKGINVVATGDFTHPFWFDKLKNELEETESGLYRLKTNDKGLTQKNQALDVSHSALSEQKVYFLLSCEISSIYTQSGKGRRIHSLFFFPKLSSVEKFNLELIKKGANLRSDGRPIVGLSARDLTEIALETDEKALVIPAHAWTPWFSVFGAFSGFDSLSDCFGDMANNIYAIETGLSSDPAMNWRIKELENRSILSFSDAHSLEKMGREATVFEAEEVSYEAIYEAVARGPVSSFLPAPSINSGQAVLRVYPERNRRAVGNPSTAATPRIAFTIEFYPQEGKYHYTGHRDCGVSLSPEETSQKGERCPVCGKTLTIGVMHRVEELAQKSSKFPFDSKLAQGEQVQSSNGVRWVYPDGDSRPPYVMLVPLGEILAEALGSAVGTKKVMDYYLTLVNNLGSEFNILLTAHLDNIAKNSSPKIAEGIGRVRNADIVVEPGYDGKFGIVKIWPDAASASSEEIAKDQQESQLTLFA
ncbi:hypothetical protein A3I53_04070 [Candidatus Curtissbacteria bacterium RIFCSPLOWO2_02_FULL_40_13b]|uniref:DNA helicase UvrD n=2 Tax=Candidatus Curtissiibacteriota TaxID=1752717 RepID=A0A1F5HP75_9BACT|nr:MAG: hypothetical protein A2693_00560 [Candidatus Curtissbacteria bacterium RIFCSPHIGHO2_01_FULL_40_12]OGE05941.1 MAG: hypothetical protein A3I53_04070 [Candidatus Curtissbacteria bacterium RIFCSPLOWO2_02_FULL_40_13b]